MFANSNRTYKIRQELNIHLCLPGITGLAQVRGIDMSDPLLLANTEHEMLKEFNLISYFRFIFITLIGNGFGDRVKKKLIKMLIINNQLSCKLINNLVLGGAVFWDLI